METEFYITLTFKTSKGLETVAKFYIGDDRPKAFAIFEKLKGMHEISEEDILYVDFIESRNSLPLNIDVITCTLNQVAENCRITIKELFKSHNLESFR